MNTAPLPSTWIDRIFEKLNLIYGRAFTARWDETGFPIEDVKADWAHELAGFKDHPEAIAYALQHLPEWPPNVLQFRDLCRKAPAPPMAQLEAPKADPERVRAELAKLREKLGIPAKT